ncbi:TerC family protein [Candidatus Palibaumannia cicadellinicola]|uniref:Magnesium and cobalt efflux protein CorC n=1 Tax=Candidatus Palibaumannia cicadellinicola TaxID=186490 RepID=A0A0K2BLC2_9GAMM|nr:CBS domain-containing protein [Candidatus Baumannia cicadellinicola]AKZ65992.1 Magnesium and cobalt efflux protein CorC [Candidatus Baumannia cicadellinicola]
MLEIILGIDNIVFVAVLADKLSPKKRDRARMIGLILALIMRILLLSFMSWIVTLTFPLFSIKSLSFSGRDLILLLGGFFLLFKATTELHELLENKKHYGSSSNGYANFCAIVVQIVIFDAVFSLDSMITAVGIINNLTLTITAVVIAMGIMLLVSKFLTNFVNNHTVLVLFLSVLLMIGLSLIAEGFGVHIHKGYLYSAICFSIIIELLNQIAWRNFIKNNTKKPLRELTIEVIMLLIGRRAQYKPYKPSSVDNQFHTLLQDANFAAKKYYLITSIVSLASKKLSSIMTPRNQIVWIDSKLPVEELIVKLITTPHNLLPICYGELDNLIGIVRAKDLMLYLEQGKKINLYEAITPALIVLESRNILNSLKELRSAKDKLIIVANELGIIQGLVTPSNILEAMTELNSLVQ